MSALGATAGCGDESSAGIGGPDLVSPDFVTEDALCQFYPVYGHGQGTTLTQACNRAKNDAAAECGGPTCNVWCDNCGKWVTDGLWHCDGYAQCDLQ